MEKRPGATRLKRNVVTGEKIGYRAVRTKLIAIDAVNTENIAPDAVTPIEVSFGTNIVSTTEPDPEYLKPGTQWIDPVSGSSQVYDATNEVFVDVAAIDTVARDAAAAAETASTAAAAAATAAQTTANGKNRIIRSTSDASGTSDSVGAYKAGDLWWKMASTSAASEVLAQYTFDGTAWRSNTLANAVIANLDAAKITTGYLAADRIQANTLDVNVLQAGTLRAGTVYTGSVAATQITAGTLSAGVVYAGTVSANNITAGTISANISLTAPTINGGSINLSTNTGTDRIVMSSSQANAIKFFSSSASYPNPGEISNGIDSITINGTLVETAVLLMRPATTTFGLFATYPYIQMNQSESSGSYMDISADNISISTGTGVTAGTLKLYQYSNYSSDPSNGSVSIRNIYFSTAAPTVNDGVPGDVWLRG